MDKMKQNKKVLEKILGHEGKISLKLYSNLLDMHSALYARALHEEYPTTAKTFAAYCRICTALANNYSKMHDAKTARQYRLAIKRAMRKLAKKEGK